MGKGKGEPEYWAAVVKPGTVLFEIGGVTEEAGEDVLRAAGSQDAGPRADGEAADRRSEPRARSVETVIARCEP